MRMNIYNYTNDRGKVVLRDFMGYEEEAIFFAEAQVAEVGEDIYVKCGEDVVDVVSYIELG